MGLNEITFARRLAQSLAYGKCSISDNSNYDNVDEKEDDGVLEELQLNSPFPVKKEKEKKKTTKLKKQKKGKVIKYLLD